MQLYVRIIYYLMIASSALPLLVLAFQPKALSHLNKVVRISLISYFTYGVFHHLACIYTSLQFRNSSPVGHFSVLIEFYILLFYFNSIRPFKHFISIAILGIVPFMLDLFWTSALFKNIIVSSALYYSMYIYFSYKTIYQMGFLRTEKFFTVTFFLYFISCLIYAVFYNFIISDKTVWYIVFPFFALINLFFYLALTWGVLNLNRKLIQVQQI